MFKANREMILAGVQAAPDLVLVSGNAPVRAGALAQLRIIHPGVRIILIWPDSLLNLGRHVVDALPIYDLVASYSKASIGELIRLGARRAEWFPFAADEMLFPADVEIADEERRAMASDVCLVGNHRPEREDAVVALLHAGFQVKVWGEPRSWSRHTRDKGLVGSYFQGNPLFGADFAKALRCAKLSLNPIDPTNYPSANMRFFESPACGAPTLNSACPEFSDVFRTGEHAFYFSHAEDLVATVRDLIRDDSARHRVAQAGQQLVLQAHTYTPRARQLLDSFA